MVQRSISFPWGARLCSLYHLGQGHNSHLNVAPQVTQLFPFSHTSGIPGWLWVVYEQQVRQYQLSPPFKLLAEFTHGDHFQLPADWLHNVYEADLMRVQASWQRLLISRQPQTIEYRWHHPNGTEYYLQENRYPVLDEADRLIRIDVVTTDISGHGSAVPHFQERFRQQAAITYLSQQLLNCAWPHLFQETVTLVVQTLAVEWGGIFERVAGEVPWMLHTGVGLDFNPDNSGPMAANVRSQADYTLQLDQVVRVVDYQAEPRFPIQPLLQQHQWSASISLPIAGEDGPFGVLMVCTPQPRHFTDDEERFLQAVSHLLTTALVQYRTQERSRLMERAIAASSNGIIISDARLPDRPVIYVNQGFERITGYSLADMAGGNCSKLQGLDTEATARQTIREALCNHTECLVTLKNYRKDGTPFWNELHISPVFNASGELTHYVGVQNDITERVAVEMALRESEERLSRIILTNADALMVIDLDGIVRFVNPAAEALFGRSKAELLGYWLGELQVVGESTELTIPRPDGQLVIAEVRVVDIIWEGSQACLASLRDVTERQKAEQQLQQSERRYRQIVETAAEGIWVLDAQGNISFVNQQMTAMLGYAMAEILGYPLLSFIDEPSRQLVQAYLEKSLGKLHGHLPEKNDFMFRRKDGTVLWTIVSTTPLLATDGQCLGVLGMVTDITDRKLAEEQLQHNALYDVLTNLPNRALFVDRLDHVLQRAKRNHTPSFAVLFLDLDRFKVVNDSLGHLIGDQLLIAIARRLETCLRPSDTLARLGGDEFTILIEDVHDLKDVLQIAERINQVLSLPFELEGHEVFTSVSIGIALDDGKYKKPDDLLRDSDTAMYQAKETGKARYIVFDQAMHQQAVDRLQLETELKRALTRQEFCVYYQPIISLQDDRLQGFEALIRWHHPERGLLLPGTFINVAEETGLIVQIGEWILRQACQHMQSWRTLLPPESPLTVSVNISSQQFQRGDLVRQISQILDETGLPGHYLRLEITESTLIANSNLALQILQQLSARHIDLAIDDFGTGYSSLGYLHRFPLNVLKIDRSFITNLCAQSDGAEIVRTIINLALNLKLEVVAEGIEKTEQISLLKTMGCVLGQGYIFSKPVDANTAQAMLKSR